MLTYGFFNSSGGDRKYNADDFSAMMNGIINDGIFMGEGTNMVVVQNANMVVNIGTGRAWFNGKWINNSSVYPITLDNSEAVLNRIDVVVLEVDESDSVRECSYKIVKGTPASSPSVPALTNTALVHQYALAEIYVGAAVTEILTANITNKVGVAPTPYVTGILDTVDTTALLAQWSAEFDTFIIDNQATFDTWVTTVQNTLTTWQGQFDTFMNDSNTTFNGLTAQIAADMIQWQTDFDSFISTNQAAFDAWFLTIQDILDTNAAANLLSLMSNNERSFDSWLTNERYKVTEFDTPAAGDITETIKLNIDDTVYATRVTKFDLPSAGDITTTITNTSLAISNTFITTFDDPTAGDITETGGTV